MIHNKQYLRQLAVVQKNTAKMKKIWQDAYTHMDKQADGCFHVDCGVVYYNHDQDNQYFDTIGCLVKYQFKKLKYFEGKAISDEAARPLVKMIMSKYGINIDYPNEYARFVGFLQRLQDAHDDAFDPFNRVDGDRYIEFLDLMGKVHGEYFGE